MSQKPSFSLSQLQVCSHHGKRSTLPFTVRRSMDLACSCTWYQVTALTMDICMFSGISVCVVHQHVFSDINHGHQHVPRLLSRPQTLSAPGNSTGPQVSGGSTCAPPPPGPLSPRSSMYSGGSEPTSALAFGSNHINSALSCCRTMDVHMNLLHGAMDQTSK